MSEDLKRMQEEAARQRQLSIQRQQEILRQQREAAAAEATKAAERQRQLAATQAIEARREPKPLTQTMTTGAERTVTRLQEQASQARTRLEQAQQAKAVTQAAQVVTPAKQLAAVKQSVKAAENTLKQAEQFKYGWGQKIQWGDKTYDLGTTSGWKDYQQALREAKSDVNKARNAVKLVESARWSEETSRKARDVVDSANAVIRRGNKIIAQQNVNVERLAEANKKLLEAKFTHDYKPKTKEEYYREQTGDIYGQLTALVLNDVVDKRQAEDAIRRAAPAYLSTAQNEDKLEKWLVELDRLTRDAERRAEWKAQEGKSYADRMKPENRPTTKQLAARLEHLSLSAGGGAVKAAPYVVLGAAGGPLVAGLIAAHGAAQFVDPKTRYEVAVFVGAHPEEFFASVAGALAAGMAVGKAQQMWGKYKAQLKLKERQALEAKWDKLIDDYTYLEQRMGSEFPSRVEKAQLKAKYLRDYPDAFEKMIDDYAYREQIKGAEFPSRVAETPGDKGPYVKTMPPGSDAWQEYIFKNMLKRMDGSDVAEFMKKQRAGMMLEMDGELTPTFVDELVSKYPELRDPFLHPAFRDPNVLNKSNLVARVTAENIQPWMLDPSVVNKANLVARLPQGAQVSPLLVSALAIVAQQGYITDKQIKQLIKNNNKLIEYYKSVNVQLPTTWNINDLKNIQLSEAAMLVAQMPVQTTDQAYMQEYAQELVQVAEQMPVEGVDTVPVEPTPTEPTPTPTKTPPTTKTPPFVPTIPQNEEEKIKKLGALRFYMGSKRGFRVILKYPSGSKETVRVEARTYVEAMSMAQRARAPRKEMPVEVDLWPA